MRKSFLFSTDLFFFSFVHLEARLARVVDNMFQYIHSVANVILT